MILDYTRAAIDMIIQGFKKAIFWIAFSTQLFTIIYLIYTLIAQTGNPIINATLLSVSVASFVYFIYTYKKEGKETNEDAIKRIFSFTKLFIKLFNLGIIIYGFYTAATVSPMSIIMAIFMIIGWILQILFELVTLLISCLKVFIIEAFQADMDCVKKPFVSTSNFFKRLFGKEVKVVQPSNTKKILDKHMEKQKGKKKQVRAAKKAAKQQAKAAKKAAKQQAKAAKKSAKRGHTPVVADEIAISENEK